jgi:rod shape-determining protein MreD
MEKNRGFFGGARVVRIFIIGFILIINNILQSTYFQCLRIRGVVPNFYIMVIVSFALLRGSMEGAIVGFAAGLIQDIYFGSSIGFSSLIGMYIGYFCGKLSKNFYRENFLLPLALTISGTLFNGIVIYVFTYLVRGKVQFIHFLNTIILPEAIYTGVFSLFVYQLIYWINAKLEEKEKHNRRLFP